MYVLVGTFIFKQKTTSTKNNFFITFLYFFEILLLQVYLVLHQSLYRIQLKFKDLAVYTQLPNKIM